LDLSYGYSMNYGPNDSSYTASSGIFGFTVKATSDPWLPAMTQDSGPSISDPNSYKPSSFNRVSTKAVFEQASYRLAATKNLSLPIPAFIKAGYDFRYQ